MSKRIYSEDDAAKYLGLRPMQIKVLRHCGLGPVYATVYNTVTILGHNCNIPTGKYTYTKRSLDTWRGSRLHAKALDGTLTYGHRSSFQY